MRAALTTAFLIGLLLAAGDVPPALAQSISSGSATPSGTAGGDLAGTYPNPTLNTTIATSPNFTNGITANSVLLGVNSGNCTGALCVQANLFTMSGSAAATGSIRLINGANVKWRNNGNSGDLALGTNASDQLTYQSNIVTTGAAGQERGQCFASTGTTTGAVFGQTLFTNASTLTATGTNTAPFGAVGVGAGNFVAKACSDGATCGAGNVYITYTTACAVALGSGDVTAGTLTISAVPANTTLTWSLTTACTSDAFNVCFHSTTP